MHALLTGHAGAWSGTASDLLEAIAGRLPADALPVDSTCLSGLLRRDEADLLAAGIALEAPTAGGRDGRQWTIRVAGDAAAASVPAAFPPATVAPTPGTDTLPAQIEAARSALHLALIAGRDSRPTRTVLATLQDRQARIIAAEADAADRAARARQAAVDDRAATIASEAAAGLTAVRASLAPPPAPT